MTIQVIALTKMGPVLSASSLHGGKKDLHLSAPSLNRGKKDLYLSAPLSSWRKEGLIFVHQFVGEQTSLLSNLVEC